MKIKLVFFFLFFSCGWIVFTASFGRSDSVPSKDLLGIAPEDEKFYKFTSSSGTSKCKDGSKKFTKSQLNDDFCDCPDGTDEPGTSACPTGKFYCRNAGHSAFTIFSSRVNDGFCDCCDGSDEYDGKTKCQNTCWVAGKVARDRLKKKIATYQEGVTIRKRDVEQAKLAVAKDEEELSRLKNEEKILKGLVQQLKERKEQIERAEEEERTQREKEEKEKKEAEEPNLREDKPDYISDAANEEPIKSTNEDKVGPMEGSPVGQDVVEDPTNSAVEVEQHVDSESDGSLDNGVEEYAAKKEEASTVAHGTGSKGEDASEGTESLSREELGRIIGSRWTGKKTEQQNEEGEAATDSDHEKYEETPYNAHDDDDDEVHHEYDSEAEDDHQTYDDDDDDTDEHVEDLEEEGDDDSSPSNNYDLDGDVDFSDVSSTSNPSWLEKIQQTVRRIRQALNLFQTPVNKSEAAHVRKEYDESSAKLSKLQSRISSLTEKLKHDFGPEKEFYSVYGQCFETKQNNYVYKVCPFKQASQVEGHSTTRLGNWEKFEESYRIMHFSNGEKCWNGPDRSLKIWLRCGLKIEVTDVDEPSRCEYEALLSTPALCREEKLKELQDKLDLMNKDQPQSRDEL